MTSCNQRPAKAADQLPNLSVSELEEQAKRLRGYLLTEAHGLSEGQALEALARIYGYEAWGTLLARIAHRQAISTGDQVRRVRTAFISDDMDLSQIKARVTECIEGCGTGRPAAVRLRIDADIIGAALQRIYAYARELEADGHLVEIDRGAQYL